MFDTCTSVKKRLVKCREDRIDIADYIDKKVLIAYYMLTLDMHEVYLFIFLFQKSDRKYGNYHKELESMGELGKT